ncbi:hydantoinase B/oxoprolinase family protein, partial [Streptomyces sp. NPDC005093]
MALTETEKSVGIDTLEREIFRYTAQSITEELEINITRTAYSPLIQEAQDYCVALITPDFRPYMQSEGSVPIFVSDMGEPVRAAVEIIGESELSPGDVFVINFGTGQHINNTSLATPLFHGDRLTGYLAIRAHWADLGGLVPGGQAMTARTIFHEGTRYAGLRIMRRGRIVPEVLATIQLNTYQKETLTGDLMSQLGACVLGERRWQERVVSRWSADEVHDIVAAQMEASAARARKAIVELPDGEYAAEHSWRFAYGGTEVDLPLKLKLTVSGDRMTVDLSEMPPQVALPINAGAAGGGMAAVRLAFRYLVGGDYPTDAGFFEPIEFVIPEGTIVSATGDAAMSFWNATISLVVDLFIRAIGAQHPELVPASHFASVGGVLLYGYREDGTLWRHADGAAGGLGAEHDRDGYGP